MNEFGFCVFELEFIVQLADFQGSVSDYAEPPFIFLVPSEGLTATESSIQVQWTTGVEMDLQGAFPSDGSSVEVVFG